VRQKKEIVGLSRAAADRLFEYHWPGNLRQLQRVLHTAVALAKSEVIAPEDLLIETSTEELHVAEAPRPGIADAVSGAPAPDGDLSLASAEYQHIHVVLDRFHGNKRRSARALGVSRSTLDRKLREHRSPHAE
jgi:DNA-binding NtrC family response regulator